MRIFFLGGTSYLGKEIICRYQDRPEFELTAYARNAESAEKLRGLKVNLVTELTQLPPQDVAFNLVVDYGKGKELPEVMNTNVEFPLSVLNKVQVKTVINFSTGLSKEVSHYAFSKKILEEELEKLGNSKKIQIVNLQLQHFYGPRAPGHNFVTFLVTKMLANEELSLTDCQQRRDFIFTDDLLDALEVIFQNLKNISSCETIEIGSGEVVKLADFVNEIKQVTKSQSQLQFGAIPRRSNEPNELVANISRLKELGWSPKRSISQGIADTVSYFRKTSLERT